MDWAAEECRKDRGRLFPELARWELRREKEKNELIGTIVSCVNIPRGPGRATYQEKK